MVTIDTHNQMKVYNATDGSTWNQYIFTGTGSGSLMLSCAAPTTFAILGITGGGSGSGGMYGEEDVKILNKLVKLKIYYNNIFKYNYLFTKFPLVLYQLCYLW